MFHPVLFFILLVTDLIHDIKGIPAIGKNRLVQAHWILDGIQGIDNIFFGDADFFRNFTESRILHIFL